MKLDIKKVLPKDPFTYLGHKSIRIITAVYLLIVVIRSCVHLFASDGGARHMTLMSTRILLRSRQDLRNKHNQELQRPSPLK
jgi:hypothetical protein